MSYSISISISGHDNNPHNEIVKEKAEAAFRLLKTIPGAQGSLSGYSNDNTGKVDLTTPADAPESAPVA